MVLLVLLFLPLYFSLWGLLLVQPNSFDGGCLCQGLQLFRDRNHAEIGLETGMEEGEGISGIFPQCNDRLLVVITLG